MENSLEQHSPTFLARQTGGEMGWFHKCVYAPLSQMQLCAHVCARPPLLWPGSEWAVAWEQAEDQELGTPALEYL